MASSTEWLVPGYVVLTKLEGVISEADIMDVSKANLERFLATAVDRQIHMVADLRTMSAFPQNIVDMFPRIPNDTHNRVGIVVVVTSQPMVRFLAAVYTKLSKCRFKAVDTVSDALAYIHDKDSTVPHAFDAVLLH
ncbi:MAG: hypothetical protein KME04_10060 [Pleurocapsa minor GSE-CHR-MK-17-07R]|nr:hypothetical protein [Pleurocapsa minor GSE-CHR-MK 17-07R]